MNRTPASPSSAISSSIPNGIKKHFLPKDKRILHATKLIAPNRTATLRFIAPKAPGAYPYLCTFPGHWILMKGALIVE